MVDRLPQKLVDPQREAEMAARRINLSRLLRLAPQPDGKYLILGAPQRLAGPYNTPAGAANAIGVMLAFADAFEVTAEGVVQTHEVGRRMPNGQLRPLAPPATGKPGAKPAAAKGAQPKGYVRPAAGQPSQEYLERRENVRQAMVQIAMDTGMKEPRAIQAAETFLFGAESRGEDPDATLERWRDLKRVAGNSDPASLENMG